LVQRLHRIGIQTAHQGLDPLILSLNWETTLQGSAIRSGAHRSRIGGFSMVELAVSLTILLILSAIAIPTMMRSLRSYQLNDSAGRVADILKFTRFEAVRRNTPVNVQIQLQQNGTDWVVWTDSLNNGVLDPIEKQALIAGIMTLLPAGGLPNTNAFKAALGNNTAFSILSGVNGFVTFDARGAVLLGAAPPTTVYVLYVGSPANADFGYRAVLLLPTGGTQIWSAPPGANTWQRIS